LEKGWFVLIENDEVENVEDYNNNNENTLE
jgi:hypothetical protein